MNLSPDQTTARGQTHAWSNTFIPTTREAPADAEMPSHIFLTRAGYIRRVTAGVYTFLPLGWRALARVTAIVREEMNRAGASELLMPALEPMELLAETGRDQAYGDDLFKVTDRHGRGQALAPTHEEVIVDFMRRGITSYKQLPLNLYQIQSKYRDEQRPRSGLLRGREFIMKDAYSFHLRVDGPGGLDEGYQAMYDAYERIFTRCGLDFTAVEAEAGPIGGSASHEFMVNCASGEDTILRCPQTGYAANVEKCEIGARSWSFDAPADAPALEKVHTPGMPGIDLVADHLGVGASGMLKTVVFQPQDGDGETEWVLATVRGDHDVNEGKVRDAFGAPVQLADEKEARAAGFAIGYVSPAVLVARPDLLCKTQLFIDPDAATGAMPWATGADEPDHHVKSFFWARDAAQLLENDRVSVADVRNALAGDPSPRAEGALLEEARGIEVGHVFRLGDKYSKAMGFNVLDESQKRVDIIMGCYGIGVSRTLAACVEMSHDDNGIIWPVHLAPYHVLMVMLKPKDETHRAVRDRLCEELNARGLDVLVDDRDERPGVKFKDADLIGIPYRITLGDKALAEDCVEFKRRADEGKGELVGIDDAASRCVLDA